MALYSDKKGRPLRKSYKRVGIRRDRNFSDLSSTSTSLENLLNELKDDSDSTFLFRDLAAIENISSEGLSNSNYLKIAGSSTKYTTQAGQQLAYNPRITFQNKLDKIKIFTGEPRLAGGNGLTANYYQNDQITFDEHSDFNYTADPNTTSADVFGGVTADGELPSDNFWEDGDFTYTEKVHPQSVKSNTGVKWEGYYIPTKTGQVEFVVESTGYFTMDFNTSGYEEDNDKNIVSPGIGTYTEYARIGISRSISGINGSAGTNEITIPNSNLGKMNNIGIGMTVSGSNNIAAETTVSDFNKNTGVVQLATSSGNAVTGTISNATLTFARELGQNVIHKSVTQTLIAFKKYRIRLRYFHHKNFDSKDISRKFDIDYRTPAMSADQDLRFNYLFSLDYDFSNAGKGDFNRFDDNSVLFGGTNIVGIGNSTDSSEYLRVKSLGKLDVTYRPKEFLGNGSNISTGIVRNQGSFITSANTPLVIANNTLTSNIEVGNYIIGDNIPLDARVISIQDNQFVVMDKNATTTAVNTVKFINHRGFVRRVRVNANGGSTTIVAASGFSFRSSGTHTVGGVSKNAPNERTINTDSQKDMIVIGTNISGYKKIDSIATDGSSVTLNGSVTTAANEDVFVYQSRGLKDNSLQTFCDRFSGSPTVRCLISDIAESESPKNVGVTTFFVEDLNGIGVGWELQGAYFGQNGISISSIETDPTNSDFKLITLSSGITRPFPDGARITAVEPAKNTTDYQLCCPPTDTSPPFVPTEDGLSTTNEFKDFKLVEGYLIFDDLTLRDESGNASKIPDGDSLNVNRTIDIKTPSGVMKLFATT
jgi:hypothetical protein|tara:strand:+ start:1146 stop:3605 length:2460 start_codon:yes stop_codon:yes gene_type:complete